MQPASFQPKLLSNLTETAWAKGGMEGLSRSNYVRPVAGSQRPFDFTRTDVHLTHLTRKCAPLLAISGTATSDQNSLPASTEAEANLKSDQTCWCTALCKKGLRDGNCCRCWPTLACHFLHDSGSHKGMQKRTCTRLFQPPRCFDESHAVPPATWASVKRAGCLDVSKKRHAGAWA